MRPILFDSSANILSPPRPDRRATTSCQGRCSPAIAAHDLVRWILTEGRLLALGADPAQEGGSPVRFIDALCCRLVAAGVPLLHMTLYAATLHPQISGFRWRWWRDRNTEEVDAARADELLQSSLRGTIEHGTVVRHRQEGAEFRLPKELRAAGCTDYLTVPLNHIGRRYPAVGWATDRAGGFAETELALLEETRPALAGVVEAIMTLRTARGLFLIYHGRHVSDRVIDGQIRRGQVEPLRAVIMVTDLRGFTSLSDRLLAGEVIVLLDDYFQVVSSAVHLHGGTVLKFIGDGVLAVFSTDGEPDQTVARAALAAARKIIAELAAHKIDGQIVRAGIALHVGTVMYGNVGSSDRLDFTVIGPAVNLAFRLESLTKELGRPVLASHTFAEAAAEPLASLGPHPIRGLRGLEEVFGLPEHNAAVSGDASRNVERARVSQPMQSRLLEAATGQKTRLHAGGDIGAPSGEHRAR